MEPQSLNLHIGLDNRFVRDGVEGIRAALSVWPSSNVDEPSWSGPVFMRGEGYTRIKAPTETPFAPRKYVAKMGVFRPAGAGLWLSALRILSVPVFRNGGWDYTDRILIHAAPGPARLAGCIAPDGWKMQKLFEELGGFEVGKQFELGVFV